MSCPSMCHLRARATPFRRTSTSTQASLRKRGTSSLRDGETDPPPRARDPTRQLSRTQNNHRRSSLPRCFISTCTRQPEASLKISPPPARSRRPPSHLRRRRSARGPRARRGHQKQPETSRKCSAIELRAPRHSAFLQMQLRSVGTGSSNSLRMSHWQVVPPISEGWAHHLLRGSGEVRSVITPAPPAGQRRPSDEVRRVVSHADSSPRHSLSETTVLVLLV